MNGDQEQVSVRPMRLEDVPGVIAIERDSFSAGWPPTAFERELRQNGAARYLVVEVPGEGGRIVAYAGLWLMLDEAHVVTVAVAPDDRRKGYGRLLVHALIDCAVGEGMELATLECRVSNEAARALYRRYGFYEVGERKRYYPDNQEDAVIMTTEDLGSAAYRKRFAHLAEELRERFPGTPVATVPGQASDPP